VRATASRDDRIGAADIIEFIERYCRVPEGPRVGEPIVLYGWQRKWLAQVYDNPHGTRLAILSVGRKNAKSTLTACLLLAHLCGPPAHSRSNSQLYSTAQSREQAAVVFHLAVKMVRLHPDLARIVTVRESAKELLCNELGTRYKALSAEAATAFGLSPSLVIHDELGRVRGPRSPLYEAMETAVGAMVNPLSIVISTQAPSDADLLSALIDDALSGHDPRVVVTLYSAPVDADPFAIETIRAANPAFGAFLQEKEVLAMAETARRMPAREAEYRNLILNQRIDCNTAFIAPSVWKQNNAPPSSLEGIQVFGGLDLSDAADLTALVLIGFRDGKWHVKPTFWLPEDGLAERAIEMRCPLDLWHEHGYLQLTPGRTVQYEYVASKLYELFERYDIEKLGFDAWHFTHLKPWLIKAGFDEDTLTSKFEQVRQGSKTMGPALRELEALLLDSKIAHGDHPVLSMCASHAAVTINDAGDRKLSKKKSTGRIDGLQALGIAIAVAPLQSEPEIDIRALIG
jgi:phage terminase large subunit-like protein